MAPGVAMRGATPRSTRAGQLGRTRVVAINAVASANHAQTVLRWASHAQAPAPGAQRPAMQPAPGSSGGASSTAASVVPVAEALGCSARPWSGRFLRQVRSLPGAAGGALPRLLHGAQAVLDKARASAGRHEPIVAAYLHVALLDLTAQAWQQREAELMQQAASGSAGPALAQQLRQASLALCGCRYLRLEAVNALALQLHIALDAEGHRPGLDLDALPPPHMLGLRFQRLLAEGLGVDLASPATRAPAADAASLSGLSWEEFSLRSADTSLVGHWSFCEWQGEATWVPAPHGKFSTPELAALLTPAAILGSLSNGVYGRSLLNAAQEAGLGAGAGQHGLAGAGMPAAVRAFLAQRAAARQAGHGHAAGLQDRVRRLSSAVAAARAALRSASQHGPQHGARRAAGN